jgi:hypothetical protein
VKKKTIEPLPPKGSFPGYDRGAAVFNTWAQALLDQTSLMNELWAKLKGGTLKADQGVKALVSTWEYSVGSAEDLLEAITTGKRPALRKPPSSAGARRAKKAGRRPGKGRRRRK